MVVAGPAHVLVTTRRSSRCLCLFHLIEPMAENGVDMAVRTRADCDCTRACGFEPLGSIFLPKTQDPKTRSVALLGMAPLLHDGFAQRGGLRADRVRPLNDARRRPLHMTQMRLGHVLGLRRVLTTDVAAYVRGDALSSRKISTVMDVARTSSFSRMRPNGTD